MIRKIKRSTPFFFIFLLTSTPWIANLRIFSFASFQDLTILLTFLYLTLNHVHYALKFHVFFSITLFLVIVLILITSLNAPDIFHNSVNILKIVNCYLLLQFVLRHLVQDQHQIELAISIFVYSGILCALIFGVLFFSFFDYGNGRYSGPSGNPVFQSIMYAFAFVILILYWRSIFLNFWFPLKILSIFTLIAAMLRTGSITPFVMILIALLILILLSGSFSSVYVTITSTLVLILVAPTLLYSMQQLTFIQRLKTNIAPTATFTLNSSYGQSTAAIRIESIKAAIREIRNHPIAGSGLNISSMYTDIDLQPHNLFILAWLTGGLFLLIFFLCLFYLQLKETYVSLKNGDKTLVVVFVLTWIVLMSEPIFWESAFMTPFFLLTRRFQISRLEKTNF